MINLYNKQTVRQIDQAMIKDYIESGYALMTRAAQAVVDVIKQNYADINSVLIVCGQGNNAGDGYVIARLLQQKRINVQLVSLTPVEKLKGDAKLAYDDWLGCHGSISPFNPETLESVDLIIDAILGTGLDRELSEEWQIIIEQLNKTNTPILAVDIPSGLDADTGKIWGNAIKAKHTVTFIAHKSGMYTAQARNHCGTIHFNSLSVPQNLYQQFKAVAQLICWDNIKGLYQNYNPSSHKGDFGKVLIIGGNQGMPGSVMLTGISALRAGAGLVKIITHASHQHIIQAKYPELMSVGVDDSSNISKQLEWADVIAIGPGLGTDHWSENLFSQLIPYANKPIIIDADALKLFKSANKEAFLQTIITPHSAEAAQLLDQSITSIETDRYQSAINLQQQTLSVVILKGAGTIIADKLAISVCQDGNAGMATAGMGDCLTGICAALSANHSITEAAKLAVCLHAKAADNASIDGQRGMIASDIVPYIRKLLP